jgi:hypothetical protein
MEHNHTPSKLIPLTTSEDTPTPPPPMTIAGLEALADGHSASGVTTPARKKRRKRKDNRFRCQWRFWMDANKPDEYAIGQALADLKKRRQFLPTVRAALRLFLDLKAGNTTVLFELFPWIQDSLKPTAPPPPDTSGLQRQLQRLEQLLLEQGELPAPPADYPQMKESATTDAPRQLAGAGVKLPKPTFDGDDQDTVILTRNTSMDASLNLFNTMNALLDM